MTDKSKPDLGNFRDELVTPGKSSEGGSVLSKFGSILARRTAAKAEEAEPLDLKPKAPPADAALPDAKADLAKDAGTAPKPKSSGFKKGVFKKPISALKPPPEPEAEDPLAEEQTAEGAPEAAEPVAEVPLPETQPAAKVPVAETEIAAETKEAEDDATSEAQVSEDVTETPLAEDAPIEAAVEEYAEPEIDHRIEAEDDVMNALAALAQPEDADQVEDNAPDTTAERHALANTDEPDADGPLAEPEDFISDEIVQEYLAPESEETADKEPQLHTEAAFEPKEEVKDSLELEAPEEESHDHLDALDGLAAHLDVAAEELPETDDAPAEAQSQRPAPSADDFLAALRQLNSGDDGDDDTPEQFETPTPAPQPKPAAKKAVEEPAPKPEPTEAKRPPEPSVPEPEPETLQPQPAAPRVTPDQRPTANRALHPEDVEREPGQLKVPPPPSSRVSFGDVVARNQAENADADTPSQEVKPKTPVVEPRLPDPFAEFPEAEPEPEDDFDIEDALIIEEIYEDTRNVARDQSPESIVETLVRRPDTSVVEDTGTELTTGTGQRTATISVTIDDERLEDLVAGMIRQELSGPLGAQITEIIRAYVEDEVSRIADERGVLPRKRK